MQSRNAPTRYPHPAPTHSTAVRTKLDWAVIISLLAMGALNLAVMADQFGTTKAYASTPTCAVQAPLA